MISFWCGLCNESWGINDRIVFLIFFLYLLNLLRSWCLRWLIIIRVRIMWEFIIIWVNWRRFFFLSFLILFWRHIWFIISLRINDLFYPLRKIFTDIDSFNRFFEFLNYLSSHILHILLVLILTRFLNSINLLSHKVAVTLFGIKNH